MPPYPSEGPGLYSRPVETLSARELQILTCLADGKSDRAIADELVLSVNTVKWYARQIYAKLGVENRQSAVQAAQQFGLLSRPPVPASRDNLPTFLTPFVGRSQELAAIHRLLVNEDCHLVTLIGPGGMGKTRLALEVVRRPQHSAGHAYFVDLLPIATSDLLAQAIADAVEMRLGGHDPLPAQLLHQLRDKRMLLLLDNFEHLHDGANLLVDILHHCPGVRLLVTSRTALGVREEWLYPVDGLAVPAPGATQSGARYSALQLFEARARQVRHDFSLSDEFEAVCVICRQVGGNPLAVELAASWVAVLHCAAIAAHLQQSLDILTTHLSNMPARHRSQRVVFDHSWRLLLDEERDVFCRLTVFHSPFSYDAAHTVAEATLPLIAALVAKSLVRRLPGGRYQLHELLRQYGAERLAEQPALAQTAHQSYCGYYLAILAARRFAFDGHEQIQAVREIAAEFENIRHAWRWAVRHALPTSIHPALRALFSFFQFRSRYLEGVETFAETIRQLEQRYPEVLGAESPYGAVLMECLTDYGWLCIRLGKLEESASALIRAQGLYDSLSMAPPQYRAGDPLMALVILALVEGDYERAERMANQAQRQAEQYDQPAALAFACYGLANALLGQCKFAQAHTYGEQGRGINVAIGNRRLLSLSHDVLGQIAHAQGELSEAKYHFESAYAICAEFEDPASMALHLRNLGDVAIGSQEWAEAHTLYTRSLALYGELGDRGGMAGAERGLGLALVHLGDLEGAQRHFKQALDVAMATQVVPLILSILVEIGLYFGQAGKRTRLLGRRVLEFVASHPACDRLTLDRVQSHLVSGERVASTPDTLASLHRLLQIELDAPHPRDRHSKDA